VRSVGGEGSRILDIEIVEVISETHTFPSSLSIIIENHLVLCNTQLLKDCLLVCPGGIHDLTTLTALVLFGCYPLWVRATNAHSSNSPSSTLGGYEMGMSMGEDKR